MVQYHDQEWGVPMHDEHTLFGFLVLGGAQAGLSWSTILRKREAYRKAFGGFDPERVARYTERRILSLLNDPGIVRNALKVRCAVRNAQAWLDLREAVGSVDAHLWQFVRGEPVVNRWRARHDVPARTKESDAMSKDLKERGFTFAGSTICYAFMQSVGMVNDHTRDCFTHER
jgi:DNA-3-methyladenine glycosylase I